MIMNIQYPKDYSSKFIKYLVKCHARTMIQIIYPGPAQVNQVFGDKKGNEWDKHILSN